MEKNFLARITAIISDFKRNMRTAQRMAKTDIPDEIKTEVTANIRDYQRELTRAKSMAQRWREHKVNIDADASKVKQVISFVKVELSNIRRKKLKLMATQAD
ncbi:putative phage tail protein [Staphylococcus aureus]|nr:putative phage tail protein [Staphylococcus aureus]CAC8547138.1 putative phage tail protein [Staphylococcus aureus]CAC8557094.1 putative phage tail protein [Staphylococcus aureus]CAC8557214.1 putative phage tail protein [Staphylococcus aureus]